MIIILWVYVAGILPVLCLAAGKLARNVPTCMRRNWDIDNRYEVVDGEALALWSFIVLIVAGTWPAALPIYASVIHGDKTRVKDKQHVAELAAANKKLDEIARKEGLTR